MANRVRVRDCLTALHRIHDHVDLAVLQHIDDVQAALQHLVDRPIPYFGCFESSRGASGGDDAVTKPAEVARDLYRIVLVAVVHADEDRPVHRQFVSDCPYVLNRLDGRPGDPIGRLTQDACLDQLLKSFAILRKIDAVEIGSHDSHALRLQRTRELERSLAAVLHDHSLGVLDNERWVTTRFPGRLDSSPANPWFWLVMRIRSDSRCATGWFAP